MEPEFDLSKVRVRDADRVKVTGPHRADTIGPRRLYYMRQVLIPHQWYSAQELDYLMEKLRDLGVTAVVGHALGWQETLKYSIDFTVKREGNRVYLSYVPQS